jgi:hypothetical protein
MIAATKVINMPTVALKFRFKKKPKCQSPYGCLRFNSAAKISLASAGGEAKVHEALDFVSRQFGFGWMPIH